MGECYLRCVGATGGYLVAFSFKERFRPEWFDPGYLGDGAVPVAKGGRGAAWFFRVGEDNLVLRHFHRGGVPGRFIQKAYIFTGADSVRSFVEFKLLDQLFRRGLPVPEPVAAGYSLGGKLIYRAFIIVRRIQGARPLSEFASASCVATWHAAGSCVRKFHDAGVFHADLNCMNILVADQVYLIDFDRGRMMLEDGREGWKLSNIRRLERSVNKVLGYLPPLLRAQLWQSFLNGYHGVDQ
ncbi:3-deoxy-D-manno-octulosonic acid kinase [Marinobacter nauticus]|uniref:3-deoxy-D-manno-octulosonic acid kinase n=1 Tax=Marinobacter nauticus TaxID=2743 RepID=A0A368XH97_MARNT|nr:3-deoxy-D-manno-octulosonic acid kinase [Marinobacter nauticus]RCW66556.1 3-deoxy-D-manno-octulosonic acid kinase [Marinobacter nauticus]